MKMFFATLLAIVGLMFSAAPVLAAPPAGAISVQEATVQVEDLKRFTALQALVQIAGQAYEAGLLTEDDVSTVKLLVTSTLGSIREGRGADADRTLGELYQFLYNLQYRGKTV